MGCLYGLFILIQTGRAFLQYVSNHPLFFRINSCHDHFLMMQEKTMSMKICLCSVEYVVANMNDERSLRNKHAMTSR